MRQCPVWFGYPNLPSWEVGFLRTSRASVGEKYPWTSSTQLHHRSKSEYPSRVCTMDSSTRRELEEGAGSSVELDHWGWTSVLPRWQASVRDWNTRELRWYCLGPSATHYQPCSLALLSDFSRLRGKLPQAAFVLLKSLQFRAIFCKMFGLWNLL